VVAWNTYGVQVNRSPVLAYREKLECGHKQRERLMDFDPPAKRRRCQECGETRRRA